eukprot:CAMPEP_0172664546 /NCGR_PEP_ID=MMETSP1074-20121228/6675_1 /TAXON_ID=2916 /ORGANISM="Ceratium fusus, Strain PA161109" /LENGTH=60 /DNA_ID=CAMNT_0013480721 /DNA_START=42 /DNA_END=224 /DNA_ORIENTATION=+
MATHTTSHADNTPAAAASTGAMNNWRCLIHKCDCLESGTAISTKNSPNPDALSDTTNILT